MDIDWSCRYRISKPVLALSVGARSWCLHTEPSASVYALTAAANVMACAVGYSLPTSVILAVTNNIIVTLITVIMRIFGRAQLMEHFNGLLLQNNMEIFCQNDRKDNFNLKFLSFLGHTMLMIIWIGCQSLSYHFDYHHLIPTRLRCLGVYVTALQPSCLKQWHRSISLNNAKNFYIICLLVATFKQRDNEVNLNL